MRTHWAAFAVGIGIILIASNCFADEPKLEATTEKLTATEEKAVRQAVETKGRITASRDIVKQPYPRILVVPSELQETYDAKPKATVRLLLKIVEGGRATDSIGATAFIEALVESPEFGALVVRASNEKTWDDVAGKEDPTTWREHCRQVCVKLVARKEILKMMPPAPLP